MKVISRPAVANRFMALGLSPRAACSITDQILSWIRSSGEEWTVSRLKDLKTQMIHVLANGEFHPDLPTPKGPIRHLFKRLPFSPKVALDCINVYTLFRNSAQPTAKQLDKFFGSLAKDPVNSEEYRKDMRELAKVQKAMARRMKRFFKRARKSRVQFVDSFTSDHQLVSQMRSSVLKSWGSSPSRRAPNQVYQYSTEWESDMSSLDHIFMVQCQPGLCMYPWENVMSDPLIAKAHIGYPSYLDWRNPARWPDFSDESWFGVISFIQEGGYKLRAVANPIRPVQALLSCLGFGLYACLRAMESDYTHDQESGVERIRCVIQGGYDQDGNPVVTEDLVTAQRIHSIDLSDATNNLPLEPQLNLLRLLGAEEWEIELFHHASRGVWSTPTGQKVRWTVGQPLGLYPSFASFGLLHHALLELALQRAKKYDHDLRKVWNSSNGRYRRGLRPWAIIGDDVAIWSDSVRDQYLRILSNLKVPISHEKSISSPSVAEFAKRIITPNGVYLPHKWSPIGDAAVSSYLRKVGRSGLKTLTARQRRVVSVFSALPEPFGLGWNTEGLPWDRRVPEEMDEWYRKGTTPFTLPGDESLPTTDLIKNDITHFWFVGPSCGVGRAGEQDRTPTRGSFIMALSKAMRRSGLPILSNVASLCWEHLIRKDGNSYTFDDPIWAELYAWYQNEVMGIERTPSASRPEIWPAERSIRRALREKASNDSD